MELAIQGWSQPQIATELGVSQAAVSKMLRRADERVLRDLVGAVERHKARHTVRLEHLYAEAIRAWERSKADTTRRRQRKSQPGAGGAANTVAEIVVEDQHGDPRYLEQGRKALLDLRKLWGLDAPQKVDLRATRDPYDDMSEEALREEIARHARLIGPAAPLTSDAATTDPVPIEGPTDAPVTSTPVSSPEKDTDHANDH
ncbi:MAG: helix-turn-helix domain-containing protein [Acidobacteria bacterium]|nr:helix-turn-helix domain-containing protein [Acidobacteriota bacterium]